MQFLSIFKRHLRYSPRIVGPGNVFFEFMQPRIAEYTITSGCQTCGTENNVTNRQESQSPYFIQQLDQIPAGGNLAVTFAARFQGSMIVLDCINSENCVVFFLQQFQRKAYSKKRQDMIEFFVQFAKHKRQKEILQKL